MRKRILLIFVLMTSYCSEVKTLPALVSILDYGKKKIWDIANIRKIGVFVEICQLFQAVFGKPPIDPDAREIFSIKTDEFQEVKIKQLSNDRFSVEVTK
jgi:hypothetical protein